ASADAVVDRLAAPHRAGDPDAVLVAQVGGRGDHGRVALRLRRLGDHLDDALVVAQVDEAQTAQVAGDVHPAAQGHGLADQRLVDEATEMGTHGGHRQIRKRAILPVPRPVGCDTPPGAAVAPYGVVAGAGVAAA